MSKKCGKGSACAAATNERCLACASGRGAVFLLFFVCIAFAVSAPSWRAVALAAPQAVPGIRDQAVELCAQAQAKLERGDMDGAHAAYREAEGIFTGLALKQPSDTRAKRDLAAINGRLGDLFTCMNQGGRALEAYKRSVEIAESLSSASPDNPGLLLDLAVISMKLGDLYVWLAKAEPAMEAYGRSLDSSRKLGAIKGGLKPGLQSQCLVLYRMERLHARLGQPDKAHSFRQQEAESRRELVALAPDDGRETLFADFRRLAEQYSLVRQDLDAIDAYQESLDIGLALSRAEPADMGYLRGLSGVFGRWENCI